MIYRVEDAFEFVAEDAFEEVEEEVEVEVDVEVEVVVCAAVVPVEIGCEQSIPVQLPIHRQNLHKFNNMTRTVIITKSQLL